MERDRSEREGVKRLFIVETTRICPSLRFAVYYFIDLLHQYNYVCIVYTVQGSTFSHKICCGINVNSSRLRVRGGGGLMRGVAA